MGFVDGHDAKLGSFGTLPQERDWNKVIFDDDEDLFNWNLAATADVLTTNSVLHCWKEISKAQSFCKLCNTKKGSLRHTLCGCQVALRQGRQTWRHDSVLLCIYQAIRQLRNRGLASQTKKRKTNSKSDPGPLIKPSLSHMVIWTTLALPPPLRNPTRCSPQRTTRRKDPYSNPVMIGNSSSTYV